MQISNTTRTDVAWLTLRARAGRGSHAAHLSGRVGCVSPAPLPIDIAFHDTPAALPAFAARVEERRPTLPSSSQRRAMTPFLPPALASTTTRRVLLGTSVALAFARTPMVTAYSAYDVQRLSGGRLVLGLGSQIKPHITRRYSMPWSRPAARMGEYVAALRAIFHAWQTGAQLDFRGDFYSHTLMPPLSSAPVPSTVRHRRSGWPGSGRAWSRRLGGWPTASSGTRWSPARPRTASCPAWRRDAPRPRRAVVHRVAHGDRRCRPHRG